MSKKPADESDEALFQHAMQGVKQLPKDKSRVAPERAAPRRVAEPNLVRPALPGAIPAGGDGNIANVPARTLKRLRRGEFPIEARLDLHGLTRDEATRALEAFLESVRQQGKRCVLVIHGKGLHSQEEGPVLKNEVPLWLQSGRASDAVLAFTAARPQHGGDGALYVLLRRLRD